RPKGYMRGLRALPWHDPASLDAVGPLERASAEIARELSAVHRSDLLRVQPVHSVGRGPWRHLDLVSLDRWSETNRRRCPVTSEVVASLPGRAATGHVYLSVLEPGARIAPHCGPTNTRVRLHLG